jgi:hypothetical protein
MSGRLRTIAATAGCAAALAGTAWAALAWQTGCQLQSVCAPSTAWWPPPTPTNFANPVNVPMPNAGAIDDDTWQTGSIDDQWLYFPGGRTYTIFPLQTSDPYSPRFYGPNWDFDVFVGTDPQPGTTGNFTIASGNLAEIFLVADPSPSQFASEMATNPSAAPPSFNVTNATCAEYYLRVVIHRYPGPDDAGVDAYPASGGDASLDAGVD